MRELGLARLRSQRLVGRKFIDPVEAITWFGAVQSQDYHGAKWGLAQRLESITSSAFDERFNRGDILRTHVMRPTWHFVTPADIRWMLALTASRVRSVMAPYDRLLGLTPQVLKRGLGVLEKILRGGNHLTRDKIRSGLAKSGVPTETPRLPHILMHAELDSLVCSGPLDGKHFTYALLDERAPSVAAITREDSLARLTMRYFTSHGPATVHDYSWWSGLRMGEAREGLELVRPRLDEMTMNGVSYWMVGDVSRARMTKPLVHMLPNYDEHIVAYRDHNPSFDPGSLDMSQIRRAALLAHIITREGFVIGGWKRTFKPKHVEIRTDLLVDLSASELSALERNAAEYGRFLGLPVVLDSVPLSPR